MKHKRKLHNKKKVKKLFRIVSPYIIGAVIDFLVGIALSKLS